MRTGRFKSRLCDRRKKTRSAWLIGPITGLLIATAGCLEPTPFEPESPFLEETPAPGQPIQNRFVVETAGGTGETGVETLRAVLTHHGLNARFEYRTVFQGFAARLEQAQVVALQNDPRVVSIEADKTLRVTGPCSAPPCFEATSVAADTQSVPWNVQYVGGPFAGTGRRAWILDTGIDPDHPDIDFDDALAGTFLFEQPEATYRDEVGRGTFLAGSIAARDNGIGIIGVAPGSIAVPLRMLDATGSGSLSGLLSALDYAAARARASDAAVIGIGAPASDLLNAAILFLAERGVRVVLAAGDDGRRVDSHSRAQVDHPNVYVASAVDSKDFMAPFSNFGSPPVDYAAPGYGAISTGPGGSYVSGSGTAVAAAHLAGILLTGNVSPKTIALGTPLGDSVPIARR
jgi:hypothetical protein